MGISTLLSRLAEYHNRHGFRATAHRANVALIRALFSHRQILFYCDLNLHSLPQEPLQSSLRVDQKKSYAELSAEVVHEMLNFWNPTLAQRNMKERFSRGASLWLIHFEGRLAGYGWTLRGGTIEPYYLPLGSGDVHLFDFLVFPEYRGKGLNPSLLIQILRNLGADSAGRAFIEAAEWNRPQLSSLRKTPFRRLGSGTKLTVLGRTFVRWEYERRIFQPASGAAAPLGWKKCADDRSEGSERP